MKPHLFLAAALTCAALPARADTTWTLGSWKATAGSGLSLASGGAKVLEASAYGFRSDKIEDAPNQVRATGTHDGRPLAASWTWDAGILRGRFALANREDPKDFAVFVTFSGGDLANTVVQMDGKEVRIPAAVVEHEFPHARQFTFFPATPRKTVKLEVLAAQFANLRDFRRDGRDDLQLMAFSDKGVIELAFDLRGANAASTFTSPAASYPGAEYLANDSLRLPDRKLSRNWVQNPSFEGDLSSWGEGITDVRVPAKPKPWGWSLDATQARSGKQSARYVVAKGSNPPMLATWPIALAPGQKYTVSFWAKTDRPGVGLAYFAQSALWTQWDERRIAIDSTNWKRYTFTFTARNPFVRVAFGDRWWDSTAQDQIDGAQIWLDDVQLEEGEQPSDFTQKPLFAWSETGTRNQAVPDNARQQTLTIHGVNTERVANAVRWKVRVLSWDKKPLLEKTFSPAMGPLGRWKQAIDLKPLAYRGLMRIEMEGEILGFMLNAPTTSLFREMFFGRAVKYTPLDGKSNVRFAQHIEDLTPEAAKYLQRLGNGGSLGFNLPPNDSVVKQLRALDWTLVTGTTYGPGSPIDVGHEAMDEAKWARYDAWLGERIKRFPSVTYWKTLNEPNTGDYKWTPQECVRAVTMMRRHIKATNPAALVLSPDPYNASRSGQAWLDSLFEAGAPS